MASLKIYLTFFPMHNIGGKGSVLPRPGRLWPRGRVHATFTPNIMGFTLHKLIVLEQNINCLQTEQEATLFPPGRDTNLAIKIPKSEPPPPLWRHLD